MNEDPSHIKACTHLLFIAKNSERICDHATKIAKNVHFLVHGHAPKEGRTEEDQLSFVVIDTKTQAEIMESK